ncbi:RDD family protein [Herbaspirillum rhizosphaerae]|uniref:RDD family protein n=1 Tax=Herbaspirillum rhizosphaerae TaxID=346179 RepID=UPI00067BD0DE|nr:RDD family protein [Herbaspirillum rhizosphaerae]
MKYAGFWRRFGAFWADTIILTPWMWGVGYFLSEKSRLFNLYFFIPGLLFGWWFYVYLVAKHGGTPGKLLLKIRIAMADGSSVTYRAAAIRYSVLFALSTLSSLAVLIGTLKMTDAQYFSLDYLARSRMTLELAPHWYTTISVLLQIWIWGEFVTMLLNKKRRAAHDFMAGTIVIRRDTDAAVPPAEGA